MTPETHPFAGSIVLAANNGTQPLYNQPKIEDMNYVLLTDKENISIPITESGKLWQHEKFDPHKKVVVMVTGWTSDIDSENSAASALWQAYMARGDTNFVLIDTARYVDTLYSWSAFNTAELGEGLGKGLAELIKYVPLDNIHLMGHSLGYVGRSRSEKCVENCEFFAEHTSPARQERPSRLRLINFCPESPDLIPQRYNLFPVELFPEKFLN